jgi:GT2 family glycosyltransferase
MAPRRKPLIKRIWKHVRDTLTLRRFRKSYTSWIRRYDRITAADRAIIARRLADFAHRPKISIVMPAYESNPRHLRAAIESVRAQLYGDWELCIADDASPLPHVLAILKACAAADSRIKYVRRGANGHISAASNSALALATGEFVALMDHDDLIPEHALFCIVHELNTQPDLDILYSDEDAIDDAGRRGNPYFKTDWNPQLFMAHNMISHFGVYRTSLLKEIGGFREGYEGSQDYDLALRAVRATAASRIRHIPRILYHWRRSGGEATFSEASLPRCLDAARRAKNDFLRDIDSGARCVAHPVIPGWDAVEFGPAQPCPKVSLIIPTRDQANLLLNCLSGVLLKTSYANFEIIIIDHENEQAESLDILANALNDKRVSILKYAGDFNFAAMNNFAVTAAAGEFLCFLNDDIEIVNGDWLDEMVHLAREANAGAVGAKLLYPNGLIQHAGVVLGVGGLASHIGVFHPGGATGYFGRYQLRSNVSAVTAACLAVKKSKFLEVGGFDAEHLKVAYNDVDLCLKLRARGYHNIWTPHALLIHHESPSRGSDLSPANKARFAAECAHMRSRWGAALDHDPYYNPNLNGKRGDFALAFPPRLRKPWLETG